MVPDYLLSVSLNIPVHPSLCSIPIAMNAQTKKRTVLFNNNNNNNK